LVFIVGGILLRGGFENSRGSETMLGHRQSAANANRAPDRATFDQNRGRRRMAYGHSTSNHARKGARVSLDQSKVGRVVAEQMEAIENDYGDDCEIGDVCTIVEVVGPHGSHVRVRSSDMRPHSGIGLIKMAEQAMLGNLGGGAE
jgi:hypothetical protein